MKLKLKLIGFILLCLIDLATIIFFVVQSIKHWQYLLLCIGIIILLVCTILFLIHLLGELDIRHVKTNYWDDTFVDLHENNLN
jgi:hypothetical protein